jgi:hypothetical protein
MGTVDRHCGGARPCVGTSAAGAARPWHALTASLSVVVCCFVWLCIRQCHDLILKTRAEQSEGERARAVAWVERAQARVAAAANQASGALLAMTGRESRAPLDPVLSLATTLLVIGLDAQSRLTHEAIPALADNFPHIFDDTLDFSRLETGHLGLEQRAFLPEKLIEQTVGMAGVWADQHAIGLSMGDHNGGGKVDILWQSNSGQAAVWLMNGQSLLSANHFGSSSGVVLQGQDFRSDERAGILWQDADAMPALALMDGFNLQSGDNVGFSPAPAWQAHGDLNGDGRADIDWQNGDGAAWIGFDLVSDNDAGFNPAAGLQEMHQSYDLL